MGLRWGWVNLKDIKHKLGNLPIKLGLPIGNLPIKLGLPNCLKICNMMDMTLRKDKYGQLEVGLSL